MSASTARPMGHARTPTMTSISSQISTTKRSAPIQSSSAVEESLRTFKLLEALRAGDHAALTTIVHTSYSAHQGSHPTIPVAPSSPASMDGSPRQSSTPLHLAVQCASTGTVEFLLSLATLDVNARDASGNTALHLAAKSNRADVVRILLEEKDVNDVMVNNEGKTPEQMCPKGSEVAQMLEGG
ncbi:ankyrin repeat-containing domain protein [Jimgerdemannia flammicorona]|uniref:Ankyrin repeat-containing domain protein n=1 Tax=Jimgerdemannia flammicorona TaxID=994334 RepID=A0A433Q1U6_9FUNG|nr:ankyrin repeat-containing domain protein [Jimgerdemannia flammicorona]